MHKKNIFLCVFFLLSNTQNFAESIDIEKEMLQSFVLETKKITIPGYPYAFNPSIIPWNDHYLMSFRAGKASAEAAYGHLDKLEDGDFCQDSRFVVYPIRDSLCESPNRIGLILMDKNFDPQGDVQLIDIPHSNSTYRLQDPRLIVVGPKTYIVYCDFTKGMNIQETRRMFVAELCHNGEYFYVKNQDCMSYFEKPDESRWQKNWVPFNYCNNLLLAYSITPHRIMHPLLGTSQCFTYCSTKANTPWQWGELRGGTPALLNGGEYLAFFHSSIVMSSQQSDGKRMQHYFMGAYTYSAHPPFELKRISPSPIVGENFYNGPKYKTWKPLRVVFPGGFVMDTQFVWIAYGRQDHEVWVSKLDKKELLKSLVQVTAIE